MTREDIISGISEMRAKELTYSTPVDALIQLRERVIKDFSQFENDEGAVYIVQKMKNLKITSTKRYE